MTATIIDRRPDTSAAGCPAAARRTHRREFVCALGGAFQGYGSGLGLIELMGPAAPIITGIVGGIGGRIGRIAFNEG